MDLIKVKKKVFNIIQSPEDGNILSKIFDIVIITLIIINVASVIAETFELPLIMSKILNYVEIVSFIIFGIEYLLRLWTADLLYPDYPKYKAKLKYMFSFMAIIDLLSVLPFYIQFIIPVDLRVLRVLRMIRVFGLFKIHRYTSAISIIGQVFKSKASQLLSSMFIVSLLMIISSVIMYNVENPVQPDKFENAFSGLWWAIATLTTVGYGDIYPLTSIGKFLSAIIAILGIGLVAVPTGIISAGFMEQTSEKNDEDEKKHFCPYCGHNIDE